MSWLIAAVVLAWALIVVGTVFVAQLILQNGRLLLRIEQVESKLSMMFNDQTQAENGLELGSTAPPIALPNLDGSDLPSQHHPKLVLFWSPSCGHCLEMVPDISLWPFNNIKENNDLPLLVVVAIGHPDNIKSVLGQFQEQLVVVFDEQAQAMQAYEVTGTPTAYLIDAEGRIASLRTVGRMSIIALVPQWLDAITTNSHDSPPPLTTRAWNLTQSLVDFAADGFKTLSTEEYRVRLEVCETCDRRRENTCLECGCYLPFKAKGRAFECPLGKWSEIKR